MVVTLVFWLRNVARITPMSSVSHGVEKAQNCRIDAMLQEEKWDRCYQEAVS
jgi:hypothetical protein